MKKSGKWFEEEIYNEPLSRGKYILEKEKKKANLVIPIEKKNNQK